MKYEENYRTINVNVEIRCINHTVSHANVQVILLWLLQLIDFVVKIKLFHAAGV